MVLPQLFFVTTTSKEVCTLSLRNDSSVTMIIPYLTEEVTYTTSLYYTSVLICNGGVTRTHVCNQINCIIIMFYISFEYQVSL